MYEDFAAVYDRLNTDADYDGRTAYLLRLFESYDRRPTLLLDLCCGTGAFSERFAAAGISVIGVDCSADMLAVAHDRHAGGENAVLYLCQDAAALDLYGTVDGAVCCMDSLNHLINEADMRAAIARTALFLEPGRLFIFDVNTPYKHETVLGNNTFVLEEDGVFCVWENRYNQAARQTEMSLDFFVEQSDGRYRRFSDTVTERAYTASQIEAACAAAGLEIAAVLGDCAFSAPQPAAERVFYVTRKRV